MTRTVPSTHALVLAAGLGLLGGCLAPPPGSEEPSVSIAEVERMVTEGAEPVSGELLDGRALPEGLGDPMPLEVPANPPEFGAQDTPADPPRESPYLRFGERILVHTHPETGQEVITKPYPLPIGKAQGMMELLAALQPFPYTQIQTAQGEADVPEGPPDPDVVEFLVLEKWDKENFTDPTKGPTAAALTEPVALSDLLVATASYGRMEEVEDFINLFAAGARQIEIEAKIVEVIETDSTDIGIKPLEGVPIFDFPSGVFVDALDFNLANTVDPTEALLTLGAVQDGTSFNAILEALESFGNVSIDQKPKVAVREGVPAQISSTEEIPFYTISSINPSGNFSAQLTFKPIGVELYVTPRVIGTRTLALDVHIVASQRVGVVETFTGTETLESPIIASRTAKTVVYLRPGEALIIGGLTTERATQRVNRVPILGQIPILGLLFQSKLDMTEKSYAMFVISPRIIQGNEFKAEL